MPERPPSSTEPAAPSPATGSIAAPTSGTGSDGTVAVAVAIAIDGPAGAGKSTVARALAQRLGFFLLDTGAIYRSLALLAGEEGIALDDEAALGQRAARMRIEFAAAAQGTSESSSQVVFVDGRNVTAAIRTAEISSGASKVSALPAVRAALLELQRGIARRGGCVVEGRDIGTVVLPDAPAKFFLTAGIEERARRRHAELIARGEPSDLAATAAEMAERDRRDAGRHTAPLRQADDAILLDSSSLTVEEVVQKMEAIVRSRFAAGSLASSKSH